MLSYAAVTALERDTGFLNFPAPVSLRGDPCTSRSGRDWPEWGRLTGILADDIIVFLQSDFSLSSVSAISAEPLIKRLQIASRFVLDDTASAAAQQVARSTPSSILSVLRYFDLPFGLSWVEWAGKIPGMLENNSDNTATPRRFGLLFKYGESNDIVEMYFFWVHYPRNVNPILGDIPPVNCCPLAVRLNRSKTVPKITPYHLDLAKRISKWHNEKDILAVAEMLARVSYFVPDYMVEFFDKAIPTNKLDEIHRATAADLGGEVPRAIAVICLLNTKNCIEVEVIDNTTLNRARQRRGKPDLLSHSVVKISLSKIDKRYSKDGSLSKIEIRRHLVRGHFKLRRGGIFWWRPFIRGTAGEPTIPATYALSE